MSVSRSVTRRLFAAAALMLALTPPGAYAVPITYAIVDDFGSATLSGTITTDGTIGAVGNANILDWSIALEDGTNSAALTRAPLNSELFAGNGVLQATATQLAFDHSVNQIFLISDFAILNFWCLEGPANGCFGQASTSNISIEDGVGPVRDNLFANSRTGLHVYGTVAVPAPPTLVLLGIGFVAMLGAARRRGLPRAV